MAEYKVYLYRSGHCIRGWLSYLRPPTNGHTITVIVQASTGAKAKNAAITAANKDFSGVEVVEKNYTDSHWGINNFPELLTKFPVTAEAQT